ncbi:hypothetical protein ASD07_29475 [Duganella sp. Root336D2]|nr:hypothetical protein ASD07_29475 [Duganella sp. Root336D2]
MRFRSDADLSEIKKALAEKINAIDSKFDSSTMCKTTSGIIDLVVDVSKEERDCLISVDHNLRKKSLNGAATMLVGIVLILLAWIIFNGWAAVAVLVVLLWNKHIEDNSISVDRLDDCLSSLKAEFEKK